ncbi:hypothetical protein ACNJZD_05535 [Streptomyces ipomoeae]|uniref:hypothetical protein n=1 Tax=Streptomyces ipomoeae TaxID=103232 RepID=UPI0038D3DFF2
MPVIRSVSSRSHSAGWGSAARTAEFQVRRACSTGMAEMQWSAVTVRRALSGASTTAPAIRPASRVGSRTVQPMWNSTPSDFRYVTQGSIQMVSGRLW